MMVVVGGRNPGGTARWYSPAGAGTRHLTRGGGSNHLHLLRGKGQKPLEESLLALRFAMASAPLRPCLRRAQPPPCDPRVARTLRRPRAPLLPCLRWLGRDGSWAPGALLRRRLDGRWGCGGPSSLARAGGRRGSGHGAVRAAGPCHGGFLRKGLPALSCEASPPSAIDCGFPVPYLQVGVTGTRGGPAWRDLGMARWAQFWKTVARGELGGGRGQPPLGVECKGRNQRPLGSGWTVL